MKSAITNFWKKDARYFFSAFFIPVIIMALIYGSLEIYFGSARSVLASDAFSQFSNFHASFNNVLHGKQSIFYSWNASMGLNYYALISYYLGGIFTPLVFFFDNSQMPDALYLLTLLKIGSAGASFWVYAKKTFKIQPWTHVALAIAYSLMSFITAQSELIMWLDTFVYLPLIFLGINRLMDSRKPTLLFVSYFLLFVSNFYFGFIVGLFSFIYFWARTSTNWKVYKRSIPHYLTTSLLAGCASMVMILPTILDLRSNGETLTKIAGFKTEATAFWDIVIKNMVGSFDTTKYGSIPFIYIGLLPLVFCVFYFVSKKIPLKNKIAYALVFIVITASFYIVPLNLFWHGMHAPNMFLFRYSFTFSFMVIMLAGYALESFSKEDGALFTGTTIVLIATFVVAYSFRTKDVYAFLTDQKMIITIIFIALYLVAIIFFQFYQPDLENKGRNSQGKHLALLLVVLVSFEVAINTRAMLAGILDEWVYASRSLYEEPYRDYSNAIKTVQKQDNDEFYRIETLDSVSSNDSINYGFSGISMFSSIRNRNNTEFIDSLGFRARGTGLNIRYPNNTLLMDSIVGIKYNHVKTQLNKYGFEQTYKNKTYKMYKNDFALSLGTLTNKSLYKTKFPANDNLSAQTNLTNQLSGLTSRFYSFTTPRVIDSENTTVNDVGGTMTLREVTKDLPKTVTWEVEIPAGQQAYFSLYPTNFGELSSSTAELMVNGLTKSSQIDITGQYYDLGFYDKDTVVTFSVSFRGTTAISFMSPPIVFLDVAAYEKAFKAIKSQSVSFKAEGRKASGTANVTSDNQVLFTTIPFDKGWTAYVDGKKTPIKPFKNALITIPLEKGNHNIQFIFLPKGFKIGVACLLFGVTGFISYNQFFIRHLPKEAPMTRSKRRSRK